MDPTTVTNPRNKNKPNHSVKFDVELDLTLSMHPHSPELNSGSSLKYELVAVIKRAGKDVQCNHYIAYCNTNAGSGVLSVMPLHEACRHAHHVVAA